MRLPRLNPRQRRGVYLLAASAVLSALTFSSVRAYVESVHSQVGPMQSVLRVRGDVHAFDPLVQVDEVLIPRRWVPPTAVTDPEQVRGLVAAADLRPGSILQRDMLVAPPAVGPDQRAVTITLPADGLADGIDRGSRVDVVSAFGTKNVPNTQRDPVRTKVVLNGVLVVAREQVRTNGQNLARLTLALGVRDSLALSYAQSFGSDLRLLLVGHDSAPVATGDSTYQGA